MTDTIEVEIQERVGPRGRDGLANCTAVVEAFGHSLTVAGVFGLTEQAYPQKLGKMLRASHIWNSGVGGSRSCVPASSGIRGGWSDIYQRVTRRTTDFSNTNNGGQPYLPSSQIFIHHQMLNDLAQLGSLNLRPAIEAHRGIISRALCAAVDENDSIAARTAPDSTAPFTYTGTWIPGVTTLTNSGAGYNSTTVVGSKATYRTPADFPGGLFPVVLALVVQPTDDYVMGVKIDGVAQPDIAVKGSLICDNNTIVNNTFVMRFCGGSNLGLPQLSAGAHTLELELKSKVFAGSLMTVDWAGIECQPSAAPIVVVPSANRPFNYAIWNGFAHGPLAGVNPMNNASIAAANVQLQALVAEFNTDGVKLIYVDIDGPLGQLQKNFAFDQTHLNNAGHIIVTRAIKAALDNSLLMTMNWLSNYVHINKNINWQEVGGFNGFAVALMNSWVNFGSNVATLAFRLREDGWVVWKGVVKNGTFNLPPCIAPQGFRVAQIRYWPNLAGLTGACGMYTMNPADGSIYCFIGGVNTFADYENIMYPVEA